MEDNVKIYVIDEDGRDGKVAVSLQTSRMQGTNRAVVAFTPPELSADGKGHVTVVAAGADGKVKVTDTELSS